MLLLPRVRLAFSLLLLLADLHFNLEDVVFEVTLLLGSIWEDHLAVAVLNTPDPLALVAATISPVHLTVAVPLILLVLSLVDVATRPLEDAVAVFPIV